MQEENYYFSKAFKYQNGFLFCENVSVAEIKVWLKNQGIARVTPAFVYSKSQIEENVLSYQNALSASKRNTQLNYALKANFNLSLVRIIKSIGCSLTLVSGLELELSLKLGFQPENIVLNGNGKELWEIELAVRNGCLLNIDGMFNATQTTSVCRKLQKKARVLLRINPNIDPVSVLLPKQIYVFTIAY
jgi:diaminopimelate decarboxylase